LMVDSRLRGNDAGMFPVGTVFNISIDGGFPPARE